MQIRLLLTVLSTLFLSQAQAQIEANMLGNWQDNSLTATTAYNSRYNDVWGYAKNGREYAIIGSTEAIHIIDVTDPANPQEIQRVAGQAEGTFLIHRDMKVFQNHLYCVADEGSSSLQIIDLSMLPDTAIQVYNSNEFVITSHNTFIDSSQARLYIVGKGSTTTVLDISDPAAPVFMASYPKPGFPLPYVHDAYVKDNIGYMNCASKGLWVVDFTDPINPHILGTMDEYPDDGYNHSGWLSDDGKYYFMCDETHGMQMKVVDVSDPSDLKVVQLFSPGFRDNEIPHNVAVKDGLLYVSHYYDGMQVFDVSHPLNPVRVAEYDTYPDADAAWYAGNWGIYPFLPSGNILLSDMQYGLFVIEELPASVTQYLDIKETEFDRCAGESVEFEMTVGSGFSDTGVTLSATSNNLNVNVEFVPSGTAMPGDVVAVVITNITASAGVNILADDGTDSQTAMINISIDNGPTAVSTISSPMDGGSVYLDNINFAWGQIAGANKYRLEISTDETDFENTIVFNVETTNSSYTLTDPLEADTTYFWRVISIGECDGDPSQIWGFTTFTVNSTTELNGKNISIYPNPAHDYLVINFEKEINTESQLEVYATTGQRIFNSIILAGQHNFKLSTSSFPSGIYLIKMTTGENVYTQSVIVK